METAVSLRSFYGSTGGISHASSFKKPGQAAWSSIIRWPSFRRVGISVSCSKTPEATVSKSNVENITNGSTEKHGVRSATFPNAFEALLLEVCDETSIAELQLKVGDFEMHLKRNVGATSASVSVAPPVPSEPMVQSAPSPSTPKPSLAKVNPLTSASSTLQSKLAALEASGTDGYILVTTPTVGSFRKGRTVKDKVLPPICKQGDIIKEGQVIGYVDQFGTQLPVKSDVAGEVLKILVEEGEAVGYGDPLIAVLPSFHDLNL